MSSSSDYWTLAHQLWVDARAGNADAQYYLSDVLARCARDIKLFLRPRDDILAPDQIIQSASKRHLPLDEAQLADQRCHAFLDNGAESLGTAAEWLARATAAGQPVAQSTMAEQALMQASVTSLAQENHVPAPDLGYQVDPATDARELLLAAVQSGDPQVYFRIGEMQLLLHPEQNDSDTMANQFAWWVVACERGFDCSSNSEWIRNSCALGATCASTTSPVDYVQSLSGDLWPEVEQRARDIGTKLDLGQWNALGISS